MISNSTMLAVLTSRSFAHCQVDSGYPPCVPTMRLILSDTLIVHLVEALYSIILTDNLFDSGESSLTIAFSCFLLSDIHLCVVFESAPVRQYTAWPRESPQAVPRPSVRRIFFALSYALSHALFSTSCSSSTGKPRRVPVVRAPWSVPVKSDGDRQLFDVV